MEALSHFHLCWREWGLHAFHEASWSDFQSTSVSSSTLRKVILYICCLTETTIRNIMQHILANQNIAISPISAHLAFVSNFDLECIRPAELRQYNIKWVFEPITYHLFWHCFGVRVPQNAFDTETQNPQADTSVIPTLANSSIPHRSWLSSFGDQAP